MLRSTDKSPWSRGISPEGTNLWKKKILNLERKSIGNTGLT